MLFAAIIIPRNYKLCLLNIWHHPLPNTVSWPQHHNTSTLFPKPELYIQGHLQYNIYMLTVSLPTGVMCAKCNKTPLFLQVTWTKSINGPFIPTTVAQLYLKLFGNEQEWLYLYTPNFVTNINVCQLNLLKQEFILIFLPFLSVEGKRNST